MVYISLFLLSYAFGFILFFFNLLSISADLTFDCFQDWWKVPMCPLAQFFDENLPVKVFISWGNMDMPWVESCRHVFGYGEPFWSETNV